MSIPARGVRHSQLLPSLKTLTNLGNLVSMDIQLKVLVKVGESTKDLPQRFQSATIEPWVDAEYLKLIIEGWQVVWPPLRGSVPDMARLKVVALCPPSVIWTEAS